MPVTVATSGYGTPMEVATNGYGIAITQVASGGLPVVGVTFGPSIVLSNYTVFENSAVNTVVGTLSMSGTTGTPTYTLTGTAGGRFKIVGNSLQVAAATIDYETAATHGITVSVSGVAPAVSATNFTIVVLDVTAAAPVAPVLLLTSGPTDNTPDFTLTGDLALGDTVRLQYGTASDFTGASAVTNTVDAGEDAANTLSLVTGALADGTWYFRARTERPDALTSDWSNTESVTLAAPSTPAWVLTGFDIDMDFVNNRYWNGTAVVALSTLLTTSTSHSLSANGLSVTLAENYAFTGAALTVLNAIAAAAGTGYGEFNTATGSGGYLVDFARTGDGNRPLFYINSPGPPPHISYFDGVNAPTGASFTLGANTKVALAWSGSTASASLNGGAALSNSWSGNWNISGPSLGEGSFNQLWPGYIRRIAFKTTRLSNAELVTITT